MLNNGLQCVGFGGFFTVWGLGFRGLGFGEFYSVINMGSMNKYIIPIGLYRDI